MCISRSINPYQLFGVSSTSFKIYLIKHLLQCMCFLLMFVRLICIYVCVWSAHRYVFFAVSWYKLFSTRKRQICSNYSNDWSQVNSTLPTLRFTYKINKIIGILFDLYVHFIATLIKWSFTYSSVSYVLHTCAYFWYTNN